MHLTKRQSLIAATAVLIAFFAIAALVTQRSRRPASDQTAEQASTRVELADIPPSSENEGKSMVVLNEFHRSEIKDGKTLWEIAAKRGRYFPESSSAELSEATLHFYRAEGEKVQLKAKQAKLFFDGETLTRADLAGGISVNYKGELFIKTDTASFSRETNSIHAPGAVQIRHKLAKIRGKNLQADLTLGQLTLAEEVDTVLFASRSKGS